MSDQNQGGFAGSSDPSAASGRRLGWDEAFAEPTVTEPTVTEPTITEPTVTEPTVTEPTITEPTLAPRDLPPLSAGASAFQNDAASSRTHDAVAPAEPQAPAPRAPRRRETSAFGGQGFGASAAPSAGSTVPQYGQSAGGGPAWGSGDSSGPVAGGPAWGAGQPQALAPGTYQQGYPQQGYPQPGQPGGYPPAGYGPPTDVPPGYVPPGYVPAGYVPVGYVPAGYVPAGSAPADGTAASMAGAPWSSAPTQRWQAPAAHAPGQGEVLTVGAPARSRTSGRGRWIAAGVTAVALVAGLGTGGAWVYANLAGGGDQPEQHLPANVAMAVRLDLDPSLSQKVDAIRFATKFPASRNLSWESTENDPRKWLFEQLSKDAENAPAWSEVEPWLGKRAAVAVSPTADGKDALGMIVIQVTDEAKAKATLSTLTQGGKPVGVAVADGWALVSDTAEHATTLQAQAAGTPLSASPTFTADLKELGDQGVASLWFDYSALGKLAATGSLDRLGTAGGLGAVDAAGADPTKALSSLTGHGAVALRFSGPNLELAGTVRDYDPELSLVWGTTTAKVVAPQDALAVFSVAGLGKQVSSGWSTILEQFGDAFGSDPQELLDQVEAATGLQLPKDIETMLGDQFEVVVRAGMDSSPDVGVRVETASPDAERVFSSVGELLDQDGTTVSQKSFGGGWAFASSPASAAALANGGNLASTARFKNAVPQADGASAVAFVDLAKAFALAPDPSRSAQDQQALDVLDAVGFSTKRTGDTSASFALRLTTR